MRSGRRRIHCSWGDIWPPIVAVVALVVIIGGLAYMIYRGTQDDNHFVQQCHEQGGHTVAVSRSMICVGADGRYLGQE